MNSTVKTCEIHGNLTKQQTYNYSVNKKTYLKCSKCQNKWSKKHYSKNKNKYNTRCSVKKKILTLKSNLKKRNNISIDEYNLMVEKQCNLCAICKKPESRKDYRNNITIRLSVDHCHKSQKIRGLLCDKCNRGIGHFDDSPEILKSAIDYLINNN